MAMWSRLSYDVNTTLGPLAVLISCICLLYGIYFVFMIFKNWSGGIDNTLSRLIMLLFYQPLCLRRSMLLEIDYEVIVCHHSACVFVLVSDNV